MTTEPAPAPGEVLVPLDSYLAEGLRAAAFLTGMTREELVQRAVAVYLRRLRKELE